MNTLRVFSVLFSMAILSILTRAEEVPSDQEQSAKSEIEAISPDRRFGFRHSGSISEGQSYELINRKSGKVLTRVAEAEADPGPSARFIMKVLWRPDSRAFALTAMLWKRGSYVAVFLRKGTHFREVKLPDLIADIPDKLMKGKSYPHIMELNSQSAKRWQNNGSLVMEIENIQDGNDGSITALRTVVLQFGKSAQARVVRSRIKFSTEK